MEDYTINEKATDLQGKVKEQLKNGGAVGSACGILRDVNVFGAPKEFI